MCLGDLNCQPKPLSAIVLCCCFRSIFCSVFCSDGEVFFVCVKCVEEENWTSVKRSTSHSQKNLIKLSASSRLPFYLGVCVLVPIRNEFAIASQSSPVHSLTLFSFSFWCYDFYLSSTEVTRRVCERELLLSLRSLIAWGQTDKH